MNHTLEDVLAAGMIKMDIAPSITMPGIGFMARNKVHGTIRLVDGLWYCFRYADVNKAAEFDSQFSKGILAAPLT